MKKGLFLPLIMTSFLSLFSFSAYGAELLAINFQQKGEQSELEMIFDDNEVQAKKFHVSEDKQIIVDLIGVSSTERAMRAFDTSEFSGSIVFISAYKKPGSDNSVRVALQLRDNVRSVLKRRPNRLVLEVENRFGVFSQNELTEGKTAEREQVQEQEDVGKLLVPKSETVEDILTNLTLSGRKKYIGKKISVNVKDLSVEDALNFIAGASGFNIITTKEIKDLPPLTLNLTNLPWDQVLDTILGLNKLVAKKNGIILMVTTLAKATEEKRAEIKARDLAKGQEPLVTKVFPISYAETKELGKILQDYLTKERGRIALDERTNSIIVRDTAEIIEKMAKIIDALDTQTPQVLIEGKVVEVDEDYRKQIGLTNGLGFGYDPVGSLGSNVASPVGAAEVTAGVDGGPGFSFSSAPTVDAPGLFGLSISRFGRLTGLNFELQVLENESKVRIVSTPKVVTQNNKKAKLDATESTSFATNTTTGDETQTGFAEAEQKLLLEVTPQVTNEGSISLDLIIQKERFGTRATPGAPPDKVSRIAETSVLVDNGSTIVIGGLYEFTESEDHSGIPFLKDLPLVGWLFRTPYNPRKTKREMIIFITPRIINQEEAGLATDAGA